MTHRPRHDGGFTLVEIVVTITLMAIAFAGILGALGMFSNSEYLQSGRAALDTQLRNSAEALAAAPYKACATPGDYTSVISEPAGYSLVTVTVEYWYGDLGPTLGATFNATYNSGKTPACTDTGLQRLTITLKRSADNLTDTLGVAKAAT